MSTDLYRQIHLEPEFHKLQRKRSLFNWTLIAAALGSFFGLICVIAFNPTLLAVPLHPDTVVTWAIPAGFSVIVLNLMLMAIYVYFCNRIFDPEIRAIIERAHAKSTN